MNTTDVSSLCTAGNNESPDRRGLSRMAQAMIPSEILTIAYDVRDRIASGADILNLTVGDFSAQQYPLLAELKEGIVQALNNGHSNYPPAPGVLELREAVAELYEKRLKIRYPHSAVLVASGARPLIAGVYLALINPGDPVIYGIPSWNNDHYSRMTMAEPIELPTRAEDNFFPSIDAIRPHIQRARLLALNTPQNPTGTVLRPEPLKAITELVVEENKRRQKVGQRALYLLYDHIYWLLTFDGVEHHTPVQLVPEAAPYTIHIDGVSKGFAATGLRVGWGVGPEDLIQRMTALLTHLGSWAPRPEQVATAQVIVNDEVMERHIAYIRKEVGDRLSALSKAIDAAREESGINISAISPEGAIYLSIHLDLRGRSYSGGQEIRDDEDTRVFLLKEAGIALVPFRGFGAPNAQGWFRASVGTINREQAAGVKDRLLKAFSKLS